MKSSRPIAVLVTALLAIALAPATASALTFKPSSQNPINGVAPDPVGTTQVDVATGDFDDDQIDDFAAVAGGTYDSEHGVWKDSGVFVWLSDGDGTFTQAVGSPIGANGGGSSIEAADLNGDQELDLMIGYGGGYTKPLFGAGDGTFSEGTPFSMAASSSNIVLADLDGDGDPDAANSAYTDAYSVALNDGNGNFTPKPVAHTGLPGAYGFEYIAAGDFNGDDKTDLAMTNFPSSLADTQYWGVYAVTGNGDGTFEPEDGSPFGIVGDGFPKAVASGDFITADVRDDLVVTDLSPGAQLLLGNADDLFVEDPASRFTTGDFPISPVADDIDGDGKLDVLTGDFGGHSFSVGLGDNNGALAPALGSPFSFGDSQFFPSALAVGDFNNDGAEDVVTTSASSNPAITQGANVMLAAPGIAADKSSIAYGTVRVGQSGSDSVTITNTSVLPAQIASVAFSGTDSGQYAIGTDTCTDQTLGPGETCSVQVSLQPTSTGTKSATLTVDGPAIDPVGVGLSGDGAKTDLVGSPTSLDFGDVTTGHSTTDALEIVNEGGLGGGINSVTITGADSSQFSISSGDCLGANLGPGDRCNIGIGFAPTADGDKQATLQVSGPLAPVASIPLSGTGIAPLPSGILKLKAPKKVKRGKRLKVSYTMRNDGERAIDGLVLSAKAPKKLVKAPKPKTLKPIAVGAAAKGKLTFKVAKKAKRNASIVIQVSATVDGDLLTRVPVSTVVK